MKTVLIALIMVLMTFSLTTAQDLSIQERLSNCVEIVEDDKRLGCYDNLASSVGGETESSLQETSDGSFTGEWQLKIGKNPIDDTKIVVLYLLSENDATSRFGDPVSLIIRLKSGKYDLYINWNNYLGSEARVLTRFDSEKAETRKWNMSTDSKSTFYPRDAKKIINKILKTKAKRLVVQVTSYSESPVTAIFNLTRLENALKLAQKDFSMN